MLLRDRDRDDLKTGESEGEKTTHTKDAESKGIECHAVPHHQMLLESKGDDVLVACSFRLTERGTQLEHSTHVICDFAPRNRLGSLGIFQGPTRPPANISGISLLISLLISLGDW